MKDISLARADKAQTSTCTTPKSNVQKENNRSSSYEPLTFGTHIERNSTNGTSKFTIFCFGHGKTIVTLTTIVFAGIIILNLILTFAK